MIREALLTVRALWRIVHGPPRCRRHEASDRCEPLACRLCGVTLNGKAHR